MNKPEQVRDFLLKRLEHDLVGPMAEDEVLADKPSDKYLTGILFPQESRDETDNDELPQGGEDDSSEGADDDGVPLSNCKKPSSCGLSFQVVPDGSGKEPPTVLVTVRAARYQIKWLGEDGKSLVDERKREKDKERWQRMDAEAKDVPIKLLEGPQPKKPLAREGFPGLELYVQAARTPSGWAATVVLLNREKGPEEREEREAKTWFQAGLTIRPGKGWRLAGRVIQKSANSLDDQTAELIYRDALEFAVGHTCAAAWDLKAGATVSDVCTAWLPIREVDAMSAGGDKVFDELRSNTKTPVFSARWLGGSKKAELIAMLQEVPKAYGQWIKTEEDRIPGLAAKLRPTAERHRKVWIEGRNRMTEAIEFLKDNDEARRAFQLANEAMAMQRQWSRGDADLKWHPFQLAFQLLVLRSVLERGHIDRNRMDLLWFPTGGGKTEAYLGVIALLLFYRRLTAKNDADGAGVAVLMRYTLRVLTTQQFERAAALICACEVLRRREKLKGGNEPFSIGLWVGSSAIPNEVDMAHTDPEQRAFVLQTCPCCGRKLKKIDDQSVYAVECVEPACDLGKLETPLPVWTVDGDVYRVLPSMVIGTVDKFAQIARKPETGRLFGIGTKHEPPELIIQDELHLISGPLGTIAGLYEVAVDEFCARNRHRPKIIGSTATIKMADRQVKDLFDRGVYQFPPPGLDATNSCFAVRDIQKTGRLYLGVTTAGRSAKFTLQAVCASLLQAAGSPKISDAERDDYWTLVNYFNSMRELGGAHVLMLDDVPKSMDEYAGRWDEERREIEEPAELTSRRSQAEIPTVLAQLKKSWKKTDNDATDVLLSTNMISVGVDIPRLGLMVVNGQPKAISEYIQATSRVGRDRVPGLVVAVFNNNKPRDRSHFETFTTWHGTLYRDVEPTSVTPFAPRARDKALRAVLVALVRHLEPALRDKPKLTSEKRELVEARMQALINRVARVDAEERGDMENMLRVLLDEWEKRGAIDYYWWDKQPKKSLLISAERLAALRAVGKDGDGVWPAPNSMRDVEPDTEFRLVGG